MSSGGKGSSSSASKLWNYYGTAAALIGYGPATTLVKLIADNKDVWTGPLDLKSAAVPAPITIDGIGPARIYRGTPTQPVDARLIPSGRRYLDTSPDDHSAYPDAFYLVFDDCLLGQERTTIQNWEAVWQREPQQSLIVAADGFVPSALDSEAQANPVVTLVELLTDPLIGLGWPISRFDAPSWQAAAVYASQNHADTYVSVFADKQTAARAVATDLLVMLDAFIRLDASTGLLALGRWPQPDEVDVSSLPVLTADDLADLPEWDVDSWDDLDNEWSISFKDRSKNYKDNAETRPNLFLQQRMEGELKPLSLTRPYITRRAQAAAHLAYWDRHHVAPAASAPLSLRRVKAPFFAPGSLVRVDIDAEPGFAEVRQVCRIVERVIPLSGAATLTVEADHGFAPKPYTPGVDSTDDPDEDEVPAIAYVRPFEPPTSLGGSEYGIGLLVSRPGPLVVGYGVYYDDDGMGDFPFLGTSRAFALRGSLHADYSDTSSAAVVVDLLDDYGREIIASDPGAAAARNDTLLMLLVQISGGQIAQDANADPILEVFSVSTMTTPGADQVSVTASRARRGTVKRAFSAGDEVWFIRRDSLPIFRHADIATLVDESDHGYLKLQPATATKQRPLEDCDTVDFLFASGRPFAPKITLTAPDLDAGQDYTSVAVAGSLTFGISVTDSDANLSHLSVFARPTDGVDVSKYSKTISPTGGFATALVIDFPTQGSWLVTIQAQDSTGRVTSLVRRVEVGTVSGTQVATPRIYPPGGDYYRGATNVTIVCDTSGATIEYQTTSPNYLAPPGAWTTYAGAFSVTPSTLGIRVWARATHSGLTDSANASADFFQNETGTLH